MTINLKGFNPLITIVILFILSYGCEKKITLDSDNSSPSDVNRKIPEDDFREDKVGMEFVLVKPGAFMMGIGEEEAGTPAERPRHPVKITRHYYLGKYEVTVGQFQAFVEDTDYRTDAEKRGKASGWDGKKWGKKRGVNWKTPGFKQEREHPVVCISLNDARAFCRWLGDEYRLPSEAEWEYAARAGTDTAFFWGTSPEDVCRYANGGDLSAGRIFKGWNTASCDDGYAWTAPIGYHLPNRWGFYNMAGNVWEWCEDPWHASFNGAPSDQRVWGEKGGGGRRVIKGGAWYFEPADLRIAVRNSHRAYEATNGAGFRVLKEIPTRPKLSEP